MMFSRLLRMLPFSLKINHKLVLRLIVLSSLAILVSFIPKADEPLAKLIFNLQHWTDSIPQEKVYLHMDKPYYALGDTIWFKGYVTIGSRHQLSALSGAVYVDLINDKDSVVKALKLPVTSGMVMGDFTLIDDYKEGSYRIRAYTQWMRNAGSEYFFDRTFTVGDLLSHNLVAKADYQYKDIDNKQVLTALLNFTNDEGQALGERALRYQVVINKKVVWAQNIKTDALGSVSIKIDNPAKRDLSGAYIRTYIDGSDKDPIVRDFPIKANQTQTDVQFFPESGNLVNGITSKVAFKAVGVDGLGINIKGSIVDDTGNEVSQFTTLHAGMGSFTLRPQVGKTYSAKINFADGSVKTIALPKPADEGFSLSVYQPGKDSVLVRINASLQLLSQPQSVSLVAQTGGENIFASTIKIEKPISSVWLSKKDFPSGIAQFTLFNNAGEPLNERIAFIRNKDQMELDIKTAKDSYKGKEHVKIDLVARDSKGKPTTGNFSVTVIDEGKMPIAESKESTILSNILLTSDLKGYIEQPNYYFTNITNEVNHALDNLMLTQGYRRFTWKELDKTVNSKPAFEVEGLGTKITGRVTTLTNKPLPRANVVLMSLIAGVTKFTTTDSVGRFKFDGMFMTDSIKFTVQARGAKNSDKVKIILDKVTRLALNKNPNLGDVSIDVTGTLKEYIENGKKLDDIYEQTGQLDKVHRLREVRIKARKTVATPYNTQWGLKIPDGIADQSIMMDDDSVKTSLNMWLLSKLRFSMPKPYANMPIYPWIKDLTAVKPAYVPARIILDGRALDSLEAEEVLDGYEVPPESIYKIEVVNGTKALVSYLGGVSIMIFTKKGFVRQRYNPSIANITPKGFNRVREFYQPRYDKPGAGKLPDLRTTVYWNPYLKTDINGKTSFNFFNADGPGSYKVIVEGINADGELGRQVYRYTVDIGPATAATFSLPAADKNLAAITGPLESFNKRLPLEKVYLHTDKPYYSLGDTLWFKAYLTDANLAPSKQSGMLYVELYDDSTIVARQVRLPITNGIAQGQIPLPKTIFHEGGYTMRAYTNWMQNFGQDVFFSQRFYLGVPSENTWLVKSTATLNAVADKDQLQVSLNLSRLNKLQSPVALRKVEVAVYEGRTNFIDYQRWLYKKEMMTGIDGSLKFTQAINKKLDGRTMRIEVRSLEKDDRNKTVKMPLIIIRNQNIDLQFLPESGYLVAGLKSVVGFKAIGEDGKSVQVAGAIYDTQGAEVVKFSTLLNGIGAVEFTPKSGQKYTARLSQPTNKSFALPKVTAEGTVMHISNPEQGESIGVTIQGTKNSMATDSAYYLIGTVRGKIYHTQKVDINQPDISIAKTTFPTGITRFTLFKGNRPLNERAVFIDNHDALSFKITTNKTGYLKHDSVGLEIEVKDKSGLPVLGNFSLAVTDDSQVKTDSIGNNTIATTLLLNSELKGEIESPGYYINRTDKQTWLALDNLMLTQGWTGYDWKDVFAAPKPIAFTAEKEFKVTGKVTGLSNKPLANTSVLISSQKPQFMLFTTTDAAGRYEFKNLPPIDSGSFFLQANNEKGKKIISADLGVDRFKPASVPNNPAERQTPWYVNSDSAQINSVLLKVQKAHEDDLKLTGNVLKQVNIKKTRLIKGNQFRGQSNLAFDEEDIKTSTVDNLYDLLKQKVPGFRIIRDWRYWKGALKMKIGDEDVIDSFTIDGRAIQLIIPLDDTLSVEEFTGGLKDFKVANLKTLEVALSRSYPLPYKKYYYGIIAITTLNKTGWAQIVKPGTTSYRPLPLLYPQQFYRPKYSATPSITKGSDYRSTIHWEPNINTDQNGRAKVSFYTSDIKSTYTIKVSGVDASGGIGDGTFVINKPSTVN
jgi:hypothetical protein